MKQRRCHRFMPHLFWIQAGTGTMPAMKHWSKRMNRVGGTMFGLALIGASLFVSTSALAGPARDRLEAFSNGLATVRAEFSQDSLDADGRLLETSSGTLSLHAPRQFRWEYLDPFPQLIVADGLNVWIYDEDLEQVTVRAQSLEEAQSPLTVLTDLGQLDRDFTVGEVHSQGVPWLVLKAKAKDPAFKEVRIAFGESAPSRMELTDLLGNRTVWSFNGWQRNPNLPADEFRFDPPEGVEIVGDALDAPAVNPIRD